MNSTIEEEIQYYLSKIKITEHNAEHVRAIDDYIVANSKHATRMIYTDDPLLRNIKVPFEYDLDITKSAESGEDNVGFIRAHGSIITDEYIVLPPSVGIYALVSRGEILQTSTERLKKLKTPKGRSDFVKTHEGIKYYPPGSIIQDQYLNFFPNDNEFFKKKQDDGDGPSDLDLRAEVLTRRGIILDDVCDDLDEPVEITRESQINNILVDKDRDNKVYESSVFSYICNFKNIKNEYLKCNDERFFKNNELWSLSNPHVMRLSDIMSRAIALNIKGDFILNTCRGGDIYNEELHLQACRTMYEFESSELSGELSGESSGELSRNRPKENITLPKMRLLRRNSMILQRHDYYSIMLDFCNEFIYKSEKNKLRFNSKQKTLVLDDMTFSISSAILDKYKLDKKFNKKEPYVKIIKKTRTINRNWYRDFPNILHHYLIMFAEYMREKITNSHPFHIAEYCKIYAFARYNIPYIQSSAILCIENKHKYIQLCMKK